MDQLISPTPGLVLTHRGNPATTRYIGATTFVDHFTDFTCVHLMTKMNAETTVAAKRAFERIINEQKSMYDITMEIMAYLIQRYSRIQSKQLVKPNHFVALRLIIRMELRKEGFKMSP